MDIYDSAEVNQTDLRTMILIMAICVLGNESFNFKTIILIFFYLNRKYLKLESEFKYKHKKHDKTIVVE